MAIINIAREGVQYNINTQNVCYIAKFGTDGYQVFVDGYDNAFLLTANEYNQFINADYSGGGGSVEGTITSDTISNMEFSEGALTIDGETFEGGSAMVYNTTTGILSGAKDQNGNDVELDFGTITIQF